MDMDTLIEYCRQGKSLLEDDPQVQSLLTQSGLEAQKITVKLNSNSHTQEEIVQLFTELTGRDVDPSFVCFPPFYSNFGKNISFGKDVFLNMGCTFQDRGGIHIGDGTMLGMNVTIATLNHELEPDKRHLTKAEPVHIGQNVWIGSSATILPGVKIGDNAVIGAGAVVTKNVDPNTVVAGVPAQFMKHIYKDKTKS